MNTRRPLAILAATALAGLGLTTLATPASADTTVTVTGDSTDNDPPVSFQPSSVSDTSFTLTNNLDNDSYVMIQSSEISASSNFETQCSVGCQVKRGESQTFYIAPGTNGLDVNLDWSSAPTPAPVFTVTYSEGASPAPAAAPAPAAPATVDITLDQVTSEVLRTWASTATVGSWKQLPESSAIVGVDENAGKTFLGAATTSNFPVDIAQRQVDNGWGPYETLNEDGDLTSVFIPAGKWMNINGPTRLYAIWSD